MTNSELDKSIDSMQKAVKASIKKLEKKIVSRVASLDTAGGNLKGIKTNIVQLKKIHREIVRVFASEYDTVIDRSMKGFNSVMDGVLVDLSNAGIAARYTNFDHDFIKVLEGNIRKQFVQFGLDAQQRLVSAMYGSVIAQDDFNSLVDAFSGILLGGVDARGRSMVAYAELYASDSIMNFYRSVHLYKADQAGVTHFKYIGNVMYSTRDFCRQRVGKVYSREEIESWTHRWQGKSGPALTHCGGYRCRHRWAAVKFED